jgi:hypothetical protein
VKAGSSNFLGGLKVLDLELRRSLESEVSRDRLMSVTEGIARWVRLSGTQEEMSAVEYVRSLLDGYGLETELIFHDAYISLPGPASLMTVEGEELACITHSFSISTGPDGIEFDLCDCGQGTPAELASARGKAALIEGLAMSGLVRGVEAQGAAAQVWVNGERTHEMIVSTVWGSPGRGRVGLLPKGPVVSVTDEVGRRLRERLQRGEPRIRIRTEVDTRWRKTPILVADLRMPGSQDFVLFSGHIDSWHLGAMDNGGANATMVEVSRIFSAHRDRLRRGLRVAFWSGHSHGRYAGSAWYADNRWRELRRHCVAHVNIDSVGGRGATVLSEGIAMASTRELGAQVIGEVAGAGFHGARVGRSGDQSFVGLGVPSLWMSLSEQPPYDHPTARAFSSLVGESRSGGLGWWWHSTEDTVDKLDPDFLLRDARIYVGALTRLLAEPLLPLSTAAEAADLEQLLAGLEKAAAERFDLSGVVGLAGRVAARCRELDAWRSARQGQEIPEAAARTFNHALHETLQRLVSVNYSASGPFDHDPAAGVPAIPLLDPVRELASLEPASDEARFLCVDLTRARNRVEHALERALERVEAGLEALQ